MKKIICISKPLDISHKLFVYEDGEKIDELETTIDDLIIKINMLVNQYSATQLDMVGSKSYTKHLGQKFNEYQLTHYGNNNVKINYI